jgi:hypothetical protein
MSGVQTTQAINFTDAAIEVSINGAAFVDICGETSSVTMSGGDRNSAEFFPFCGDTPVVLVGKRTKIQIGLSIAYTEGLSDSYAIAKAAYETKGMIFQIRWTPKGTAPGNYRFTTDPNYSFVSSAPYPVGDASSADVTAFTLNVETSQVTQDAVP